MILSKEDIRKSNHELVIVELSEAQKELLFLGDTLIGHGKSYIFWFSAVFIVEPGPTLGTIKIFYTRNFNLLPEEVKNDYYQTSKSKIQTYDKAVQLQGE